MLIASINNLHGYTTCQFGEMNARFDDLSQRMDRLETHFDDDDDDDDDDSMYFEDDVEEDLEEDDSGNGDE